MIAEQYANGAASTLNGAVTSGATSIVVTSAASFPATGNFRVIVDSEIMLVTYVSGNTFTVTRGVESTAAAAHLSAAPITHIVTAASAQAIATNPIGTIDNAGMYIAAHFEQSLAQGIILTSLDGIYWSTIQAAYNYLSPNGVHDPSIYYDGKTYWMAYTRVVTANANFAFGLASSPDLITWTHIADIDQSAIGTTNNVWAPEWFVDDDGSVHLIMALSNGLNNFQLYETHPTNAAYTTWSTAVQITGTSLPATMIDASVTKAGGTYYIWYKNGTNKYVEVMTSTSLTSGYVVQGSGHWMTNWPVASGQGWEGPCLVQIDSNTWRMYVDAVDVSDNGLGYKYSTYVGSPGAGWLTGANWSALTATVDPFIKRHGTILRVRDFITSRNVFAALGNGNRNPIAIASGATAVAGTGTTTALHYTTSRDDAGYFDGTSKFTAPMTGNYLINTYTHWPSNTSGVRIVEVRLNGTTALQGQAYNPAVPFPPDARQEVTAVLRLNAGDYVELTGWQNSGSSLTPTTQTFTITKLG